VCVCGGGGVLGEGCGGFVPKDKGVKSKGS